MFGNLNSEEIEDVLQKQIIGRIGCYADGTTYVVPISYVYDGTNVYAHTQEGRKIKMMRENPKICFEVDTLENMAEWKSVIAWGEFEELTDLTEREDGLRKLLNRVMPFITSKTVQLSPHWPFVPEELNKIEGIVYRLKLIEKTGRYEKIDNKVFYAS